jgi:hypothetical protein
MRLRSLLDPQPRLDECIGLLSPNDGRIGKRMRNFRMVN